MSAYIRQLVPADLDRCHEVEAAAFPPAEAATREKIYYRLSACPEICYGLFVTGDPSEVQLPDVIPQRPTPPRSLTTIEEDGRLVAHTISTKTTSRTVRDVDMGVPEGWDRGPGMTLDCGHIYEGRTVALHSLAVSPTCQRKGYGKALMRAYLDLLKKSGQVDRVSILTYDRLVEYYSRQGFELLGKSEATYAGVDWYDLTYEFI